MCYSSVNHSSSECFYACDLTLEETAADDVTKCGATWMVYTEECRFYILFELFDSWQRDGGCWHINIEL